MLNIRNLQHSPNMLQRRSSDLVKGSRERRSQHGGTHRQHPIISQSSARTLHLNTGPHADMSSSIAQSSQPQMVSRSDFYDDLNVTIGRPTESIRGDGSKIVRIAVTLDPVFIKKTKLQSSDQEPSFMEIRRMDPEFSRRWTYWFKP